MEEALKQIDEKSYVADLLSRANAKWIYNLFRFEQVSTAEQHVKIALVCRAVSVLDPYWLKFDDDGELSWESVDVRKNPLNEVVAQVALHGKSLMLHGSPVTPELTTNGAYAKAWRRHEDSSLWLYKLGNGGNTESRIEVMCSNLLDKMNVEHVHYDAGQDEDKYEHLRQQLCALAALSVHAPRSSSACVHQNLCSLFTECLCQR